MEQLCVQSAWENFQFFRIKTAFDPAPPIFLRVHEHGIELSVKPVHVTPGHAFEKTVFGQDADVLRKIGMINAAGLQVEHLGREQGRETDWSGRADDDFGESFSLDVVEHLQNRGETQLLQLVLGQFKLADRSEVLDRDTINHQFATKKARRSGSGIESNPWAILAFTSGRPK